MCCCMKLVHRATMVQAGGVKHPGVGLKLIAEVSLLQQNHHIMSQVVSVD